MLSIARRRGPLHGCYVSCAILLRPEGNAATFSTSIALSETPSAPSVAVIFGIFFRIGLFSFGGGLSGWVYREVVTLRGWMDEDEFMSGLAMSQILPGANITNLSIYVGQKLRGPAGAAVAFAGLLIGPFFAVIALASAYGALRTLPYSEAAMDGVAAAAIGLLFIIIGRGLRRAARRPETLAALLATFAGVALMHWSLLLVVAAVAPVSVAAAWLRSHADERNALRSSVDQRNASHEG
jgi:chromate transporter